MKYVVDVDGERTTVELMGGDEVRIGGRVLRARLVDVEGTPVSLLTIGERVYRITGRREAGRGAYRLSIDGRTFAAEALDERTRAIRDLSAASGIAAGPAPLVAPMPGLIVKVAVAVGDAVAPGQGLVTMEAMKMENELRASASGVVSAIHVAPGTAVDKGALLVELA